MGGRISDYTSEESMTQKKLRTYKLRRALLTHLCNFRSSAHQSNEASSVASDVINSTYISCSFILIKMYIISKQCKSYDLMPTTLT